KGLWPRRARHPGAAGRIYRLARRVMAIIGPCRISSADFRAAGEDRSGELAHGLDGRLKGGHDELGSEGRLRLRGEDRVRPQLISRWGKANGGATSLK